MAYTGHLDADGKVIWRDEIYTGSTRISSLSTSTDQSEHGDHSGESEQGVEAVEYLAPRRWQNINIKCITNMVNRDQEGALSTSPSTPLSPLSLQQAIEDNYFQIKQKTESIYSWSEMYESLNQHDNPSNLQLLEMKSKSSTIDYLRELGDIKLQREPKVAYDTWYASKEILRTQQIQRQKELQEREASKKENRKKLAQICYEKWLQDKSRQSSQQQQHNHIQRAALQAAAAASNSRNQSRSSDKPKRNVPQSEIRKVVKVWWTKKQEQQERQRQENKRKESKKAREDQRRKQLAEKAFQKWISNVYDKPKPVPMNQGLDSLRGTISEIYINPRPWQHLKQPSAQPEHQ